MIDQHDHTIIKWVIGLLATLYTVSFGWLLNRQSKLDDHMKNIEHEANDDRVLLAGEYYLKKEVDNLFKDHLDPIKESLKDIGGDVKFLVRREIEGGDK